MSRLHAALSALVLLPVAGAAPASTLIDDATAGLYNAGIGTALNGTDPFFVTPDGGDPTVVLGPTDAPDLSAAAGALGDWLATPAAPGGTGWSAAPVSIPSSWTIETETAIIYAIDGGTTGLTGVTASIGVDNGILAWLDGDFLGGAQRPGGASAGEYTFDLGDLGAGTSFLQLLREDHGGGTGFTIRVTGDAAAPVPLPAAGVLLVAGLGGLAALRRRA